MSAGVSRDWIELFLEYTDGIPSPEIFRKWSAIATISGALERRVWTISAGKQVFPNLYVLLVATPGVGKSQAIEHTDQFWRECSDLHIAPHDVTKAALIDRLARASRKMVLGDADLVEYNTLLVAADEFGVLVPSHDTEFLSTLNRIFDNPPIHQQERRGLSNSIDIINPQLTIIGGTQPAYLANLLPEEAWGMGFMSRVIMVYSATRPKVKLFSYNGMNQILYGELKSRFLEITKAYGQMEWSPEAQRVAESWYEAGMEPVPLHSKLDHYITRRMFHVIKLSMVSAISANSPIVTVLDFNRARDWLLEAEVLMPNVFREMVQKSDVQVIEELYFYSWQLYLKDKKPIHEARIINFLKNRVPAERISRVLDVAVRANIFDKLMDLNAYRPRPRNEHGLE